METLANITQRYDLATGYGELEALSDWTANWPGRNELATGQIVARSTDAFHLAQWIDDGHSFDNGTLHILDNGHNDYQVEARTDGWRVAKSVMDAQWVRLTGTGRWSGRWGTFAARVERAEMTTETAETDDGLAIVAGIGERIGQGWVRSNGMA